MRCYWIAQGAKNALVVRLYYVFRVTVTIYMVSWGCKIKNTTKIDYMRHKTLFKLPSWEYMKKKLKKIIYEWVRNFLMFIMVIRRLLAVVAVDRKHTGGWWGQKSLFSVISGSPNEPTPSGLRKYKSQWLDHFSQGLIGVMKWPEKFGASWRSHRTPLRKKIGMLTKRKNASKTP